MTIRTNVIRVAAACLLASAAVAVPFADDLSGQAGQAHADEDSDYWDPVFCEIERFCLYEDQIGTRLVPAPPNGDLPRNEWDRTSSVVNNTSDRDLCLYTYDGQGNKHLLYGLAPYHASFEMEDANDQLDAVELQPHSADQPEGKAGCTQVIPAGEVDPRTPPW